MMRITFAAFAALLALIAAPLAAKTPLSLGQPRILDEAKVLSSQFEDEMVARLSALEERTGLTLVFVTASEVDEAEVEDLATDLLDQWLKKSASADYSGIMLLAPNERLFTLQLRASFDEADFEGREDAYWFEKGTFPPSYRDELERLVITAAIPHFKKSDWEAGIVSTITALNHRIGSISASKIEKTTRADEGA